MLRSDITGSPVRKSLMFSLGINWIRILRPKIDGMWDTQPLSESFHCLKEGLTGHFLKVLVQD